MDPAVARWLTSSAGLDLLRETCARLTVGVDEMAVGQWLRTDGFAVERAAAVISAARARGKARALYADADELIFTPPALEQASPPVASGWRAQRFAGARRVLDLCAGAGADALELGRVAERVTLLEDAEDRCVFARHNLRARALEAAVVTGDALHSPIRITVDDLVHADPSRRHNGRRLKQLRDYQPGIDQLARIAGAARGACILVSPAVSLTDPDLPPDTEIEFIQIGNDLVECALWSGSLARKAGRRSATLLPDGLTVHADPLGGRERSIPVTKAGAYLLEPQPALVRAGLHERLGADIAHGRLAARRALLTTDYVPASSPWWRVWTIEADLPLHATQIRAWLRQSPGRPVEIELYGVTMDIPVFWRALGSPPRGPRGLRIFAVRLDVGARAYMCSAATSGG